MMISNGEMGSIFKVLKDNVRIAKGYEGVNVFSGDTITMIYASDGETTGLLSLLSEHEPCGVVMWDSEGVRAYMTNDKYADLIEQVKLYIELIKEV